MCSVSSLLLSLLLISSADSLCWKLNERSLCHDLDLRPYDVTNADCCRRGSGWGTTTHLTVDELDDDTLWRARIMGIPCNICPSTNTVEKKTCADVTCPEGQECKQRTSGPKCRCIGVCDAGDMLTGPVCTLGSPPKQYNNLCELKNKNCRKGKQRVVDYYGRCAESCEEVDCPSGKSCMMDTTEGVPHCVTCRTCNRNLFAVLSPVCGTDGQTYNSRCLLQRSKCLTGATNLHIAYPGRCKSGSPTCAEVTCGGNNNNRCVMDEVLSTPRCIACHHHRLGGCERHGPQICASDGNTYHNSCQIRRQMCSTETYIHVSHGGACSTQS